MPYQNTDIQVLMKLAIKLLNNYFFIHNLSTLELLTLKRITIESIKEHNKQKAREKELLLEWQRLIPTENETAIKKAKIRLQEYVVNEIDFIQYEIVYRFILDQYGINMSDVMYHDIIIDHSTGEVYEYRIPKAQVNEYGRLFRDETQNEEPQSRKKRQELKKKNHKFEVLYCYDIKVIRFILTLREKMYPL